MQLRQRLVARGFSEARTSALVGRQTLGSGFARDAVELRNPLERRPCRAAPELDSGSAGSAGAKHSRAGAKSVRLFELGRIFLPPKRRRNSPACVCFFAARPTRSRTGAARPVGQLDLFDLKGALEGVGLGEVTLRRCRTIGVRLRDGGFRRREATVALPASFHRAIAARRALRSSSRRLICLTTIGSIVRRAEVSANCSVSRRSRATSRMIVPERSDARGNLSDDRCDGNRCS